MEVTVVHKGDNHNHEKDGITIYIVNMGTNEIVIADRVRHVKMFKSEMESELYQLKISYDWSVEAEKNITSSEEIAKHISISIDIDAITT
jgi:hypothetical protein